MGEDPALLLAVDPPMRWLVNERILSLPSISPLESLRPLIGRKGRPLGRGHRQPAHPGFDESSLN